MVTVLDSIKNKVGSDAAEISSSGGHPAMNNLSIPDGGKKTESQEKSNINIPKSTNVSLDAGESSDVMNASSADDGRKNESILEEIRKLPNIMTNSSQDTGSNDTVRVNDRPINASLTNGMDSNMNAGNRINSGRRLLEDSGSEGANDGSENVLTATAENDDGLEAEADSSFELFRGSDELADEYSYDYDDYVDENMWGDDDWIESQHETVEDYVDIDSHILSTPVIAIIM